MDIAEKREIGHLRSLFTPSTHHNDEKDTENEIQVRQVGYKLWIDNNDGSHDKELVKSDQVKGRHHSHSNPRCSFTRFRKMLISVFCTDIILKLLAIIFYGIQPYGFRKHYKKKRHAWLSIILTLLQWNCLINYTYFVFVYWTSKDYNIPVESALIMLVLVFSTTVTYTLVAYYFYRNENVFSLNNESGWSVVPKIKFNLFGTLEDEIVPDKTGWLLTNMFLLLGLFCTLSVEVSSFELNMFYGFHGIHNFLRNLPTPRRIQYYIANSAVTFGLGSSICSCCIFFAITRDMIRHIEHTQNAILIRARTRDDFYSCHETLHQYIEKMTASCKHWFALHSLFFIVLVFAVVYEWLTLTRHKATEQKYFNDLLITQTAGSFMIAFKFAFPFFAASRVTSKFTTFYFNIARKCRIQGIPDLSILTDNSGFKLYGLRINTATAALALLSSFGSLLKVFSALKPSN